MKNKRFYNLSIRYNIKSKLNLEQKCVISITSETLKTFSQLSETILVFKKPFKIQSLLYLELIQLFM